MPITATVGVGFGQRRHRGAHGRSRADGIVNHSHALGSSPPRLLRGQTVAGSKQPAVLGGRPRLGVEEADAEAQREGLRQEGAAEERPAHRGDGMASQSISQGVDQRRNATAVDEQRVERKPVVGVKSHSSRKCPRRAGSRSTRLRSSALRIERGTAPAPPQLDHDDQAHPGRDDEEPVHLTSHLNARVLHLPRPHQLAGLYRAEHLGSEAAAHTSAARLTAAGIFQWTRPSAARRHDVAAAR